MQARTYSEITGNKNAVYECVPRADLLCGKFMILNAFLKKYKRLKINEKSIPLKKVETGSRK